MKRSKALSLILMGSMLGSSGCGTDRADEGMYTFTSIEECVTSAVFSEAECQDLARSALAEIPRFASAAECEELFGAGACASAPGAPAPVQTAGDPSAAPGAQNATGEYVRPHSGGMWMPMMMGFMAGRFMGAGGMMQGSQGLYRDPAAQPGARSFRTADGQSVQTGPGGRVNNPNPRMTQSMAHNAKPAQARAGAGARGGFGGGFGGSAS